MAGETRVCMSGREFVTAAEAERGGGTAVGGVVTGSAGSE